MTIDWSKLDTAEMKAARVAEQNAKAAERETIDRLRAASKDDPVFAKIKDFKPEECDEFINSSFPRMMMEQRKILQFLLRAAVVAMCD